MRARRQTDGQTDGQTDTETDTLMVVLGSATNNNNDNSLSS